MARIAFTPPGHINKMDVVNSVSALKPIALDISFRVFSFFVKTEQAKSTQRNTTMRITVSRNLAHQSCVYLMPCTETGTETGTASNQISAANPRRQIRNPHVHEILQHANVIEKKRTISAISVNCEIDKQRERTKKNRTIANARNSAITGCLERVRSVTDMRKARIN